jgi:hypothetical protein
MSFSETKWIRKKRKQLKTIKKEGMNVIDSSSSIVDASNNSSDLSANYNIVQTKIASGWKITREITGGLIDAFVSPFFEIDKGIDNLINYTIKFYNKYFTNQRYFIYNGKYN